jgi:ABC-2 type transport system permease protein
MSNKISQAQQTWLVTSWEFMHFFKWKQEIVSKLIIISIGLVVFLWQNIKDDSQTIYNIAVGAEITLPETLSHFHFVATNHSAQELKSELSHEASWDAILQEVTLPDGSKKITIVSQDKQSWLEQLQQQLLQHYTQDYAAQLGLAESQLVVLNSPATFFYEYLDQSIKTDEGPGKATAIGMIVLLAVGIFTSFGQLFASITGEKQQRVTEQLYSCISPQTWIDGKILGQLCHSLKAMTTSGITALLGFAFTVVILQGKSFDLSIIDWSLLPWLFVFTLGGLYLCTAFMAAIAAAIDDPNHSAKTSIMLLPLVPMIVSFITLDNPTGWALSFLSYFPLTSFVAMPVKMSLIDLPFWQPLLSLTLLVLLCLWARGVAARLFKMGMTMYGKEPSMKDMAKWLVKEN